jgi:serine/threonine-protein kinase
MSTPIRAGDLIRQKYRVERVLGQGGMGVVVAAWHLHLDRRVAIKFLLPEMLAHPSIVERFLREGRAASAIEGEHVARVMDVDTLDDGTPYLVMEYLDGHDLAHLLQSGTRVSVGQAVSWVLEACVAIERAHRLGIVHRDLKPANLFLATTPEGSVRLKVLDFGISKTLAAGAAGLTQAAFGMGSTEYMSPEQCLSARDVDTRTDIWALGVILYQLLTLRVPYSGDTPTQVYVEIMARPPAPPRMYRPDAPQELEAVILGCLERELARRIPTVSALVQRLAPFSSHAPPADPLARSGSDLRISSSGLPGGTVAMAQSNPAEPRTSPLEGMGPAPRGSTTGVVASDPRPRPPPARATWPLVVVGGVVLALAIAFTLSLAGRVRERAHASDAPEAATAAPLPPPSATPEPQAPPPSAAPPALPASFPPVVTAATAAAPAPRVPTTRARPPSPPVAPVAPAAKPAAPPPAKAPPNCTPPYTVDAEGTRHAKPECM